MLRAESPFLVSPRGSPFLAMKRISSFILMVALIAAGGANGCTSNQVRLASLLKRTMTSRAVAFRTMDQVYPFRVVARGGPIAQLPRTPRKLDVIYQFQGRSDSLNSLSPALPRRGSSLSKGALSSMSVTSPAPTTNRGLHRGRQRSPSPRHWSDSRWPTARLTT